MERESALDELRAATGALVHEITGQELGPVGLVVDYARPDAPEVEVPLDPARDAVENMKRYFRRYRKDRGAAHTILERHETLRDQLVAGEDGSAKGEEEKKGEGEERKEGEEEREGERKRRKKRKKRRRRKEKKRKEKRRERRKKRRGRKRST
mgnify:CR=1 FL=1